MSQPAVTTMRAGGDWGSAISTALGGLYPQHCRAVHINLCFAQPSYANPWHLAQVLNAKLPVANWFPLTISYQASQQCRCPDALTREPTAAAQPHMIDRVPECSLQRGSATWLDCRSTTCKRRYTNFHFPLKMSISIEVLTCLTLTSVQLVTWHI